MPLEHLSASEVWQSGPDDTMAGHEIEEMLLDFDCAETFTSQYQVAF